MKRPGIDGGFFLCVGLNLVLNIGWAIPAVVLFVLHFVVGIPLWVAGLALAIWVLVVFLITLFMQWVASTGNGDRAGTGVRGRNTAHYSSERSQRVPTDSTGTGHADGFDGDGR